MALDASFNNLTSLPTNIGYGSQNLERLTIQLKKHRSFDIKRSAFLKNPIESRLKEESDQGAKAVIEFMRWAYIMVEVQQRISVEEAERHGDENGWVSWGPSMVTYLVSGVTQSIGF
ncbi:hypothetical protein Bca52824_068537 [Brassica carinata]|uniref:Uncharacterized protein n=1 Tax=Brassica carinata TaxID=52824 RepID=A0A8X7Q205_BRACI|nr:hypothetical protein Bca52824_068537 [Brassica carinata]